MRVVVLAGGNSPEREVSMVSGTLVANALSESGCEVLLLDLSEGLKDLPKDLSSLFRTYTEFSYRMNENLPKNEKKEQKIGENVLKICRYADCVFLALHGGVGENGKLQSVLDCFGIPYTGSDPVGSMLAMEKDLSKRLFRDAGIPTPEWVFLKKGEKPEKDLPFPCVVKPAEGGSSLGVVMAENRRGLRRAIRHAKRYGEGLLIERKITGREFTVGVLGGKTLPPVEIRPKKGFYDYRNKYNGETEEICPADLSEEENERLAGLAMRGFSALRLRGYARFDFLQDENGVFWCLEANTLPGMTEESLLPKEAKAAGISYAQLCKRILKSSEK